MKTILPIASLFLVSSLIACSGEIEESPVGSEDALRTTTVQDIVASYSPGYVAFDKDVCAFDNGQWALDFSSRKLTGSGCVDGSAVKASRILTATELESVRKAIRRVRPVATPASCPTDGPSAYLEIHRQSKPNVKLAAEKYIDEQNSCFATGHVAATNLPPVALLLGQLAAVGSSPAKCGGPNKITCAKGSTCFRNGAFPDAYGTCAVDTGVVCEALATCDPSKATEVKACAPGASCYYSSICGQEILCQNKPVAASGGKCGGSNHIVCKEGESCLRNGAFPDASGTCVNLADPQCAALALCDPNKEKQVSACAPGATCNYVSQCGMEILCQVL